MTARSHPGSVAHIWDHFVLTLRAGAAGGERTTLSLYAITWSPTVGSGNVAVLDGTHRPTTLFQDAPGLADRMRARLLDIGSGSADLGAAEVLDAHFERHPATTDGLGFTIRAAGMTVDARWHSPSPPAWVAGPAPAFWDREDIWAAMLAADTADLLIDGVPSPGAPFLDDVWVTKIGRPLSSAHVALAEVRVTPDRSAHR